MVDLRPRKAAGGGAAARRAGAGEAAEAGPNAAPPPMRKAAAKVAQPPKKRGRPAKAKPAAAADADDAAEGEVEPVKEKRGRRAKAKVAVDVDDEDVEPAPVPVKPKRTKPARAKRALVDDDDEDEDVGAAGPSKGKKRAKGVDAEEDDRDDAGSDLDSEGEGGAEAGPSKRGKRKAKQANVVDVSQGGGPKRPKGKGKAIEPVVADEDAFSDGSDPEDQVDADQQGSGGPADADAQAESKAKARSKRKRDSDGLHARIVAGAPQFKKADRKAYAQNKQPAWTEAEGRQWLGQKFLGGGGFGAAFLYYQVDEEGIISDRVAVKDCFVPRYHWSSIQHWSGNPKDKDDRQHMEIAVMESFLGRTGADNVVRVRHFENDDDNMAYRIYMEYCSSGSLDDLIEAGYKRKNRPRQKTTKKSKRKAASEVVVPTLPEPALWAFLSALTDAACLMGLGSSNANARYHDWTPVVHRDLKTENVWLDDPNPKVFATYPQAKLGDFGIAIMTDEDDAMNPQAYNDQEGTPGWMPAEMILFQDAENNQTVDLGQLLDWTNVWGIGAIMIRLMNGHTGAYCKSVLKDKPTYAQGPEEIPIVEEVEGIYSDELRELVRQCVRFRPEDRMPLLELREAVRKHTNPGPEDRAEGLKDAPADADVPVEHQLSRKEDEYRIGLAPDDE